MLKVICNDRYLSRNSLNEIEVPEEINDHKQIWSKDAED